MPPYMLTKPHDTCKMADSPLIACSWLSLAAWSSSCWEEARESRCFKLRSRAGTPPCAASKMRGAKGIKAVADACCGREVNNSNKRHENIGVYSLILIIGTRGAMASSGACANPSLRPPVSTRQHCVSLSQLQSSPQTRLDGEKLSHLIGSPLPPRREIQFQLAHL